MQLLFHINCNKFSTEKIVVTHIHKHIKISLRDSKKVGEISN